MLLVLTLLPLSAIAFMSLASTAQAAATVSPTIDKASGFPAWYEDNAGNRVVACTDANDPNCGLAAEGAPGGVPAGPLSFDPNAPLTVPANFPDEFFYSSATSDNITTPGCDGTAPGRAFVTLALEGAFLNGSPVSGQQMTFGRIRVRVSSGLCPNTTYTFKEPFGTVQRTTDGAGAIVPNNGTTDVGCTPAPPVAGCDFTKADASPLMGDSTTGFLRWDPNVAPAAPAGYLGDGATLHAITGGTTGNDFSILDASGDPVTDAAGNVENLTTNQFAVIGKLAGPLSASPSAVDFGGQTVGSTSAAQVTITNLDQGNVVPGAATIGGTDATDFAVSSSTCTGTPLARDASCSVNVTFTPSVLGKRSATLVLPSTGGASSPQSVPLTGTGINAGDTPGVSVDPTSIDFGSVRILTLSPVKNVVVTNTGTAPLKVNSDTLSGATDQFRITSDTCTLGSFIDAGKSCVVSVAMVPSVPAGTKPPGATPIPYAATLTIDTSAGTQAVALNGDAIGGYAAVSPTNDPNNGFPLWYRDDNGIKVQQCNDPTNPNCIIVGDQFYNPAEPMIFPTNWPTEFFYQDAESDKLVDPSCAPAKGGGGAGVMFRSAIEGSFISGTPLANQQITFGRIRIQAHSGLCPNETYTFVEPYGTVQLSTDATGTLKVKTATSDVGCAPLVPDTCDFTQALSAPNLGGLLRWDPTVPPAAPAGYLGDAVSLHQVTGSTFNFQLPGQAAPAPVNYFAVLDSTGKVVAQTKLFTVMGKLQGPLEADPASVNADVTTVGDTSTPPPVTFTNTSPSTPLTINTLNVTGTDLTDFAITSTDCTGITLQPNDSCTATVNFTPTAVGSRTANIVVDHTGLNDPFTLQLNGVGAAPPAVPAVSFSPRSLTFYPLHDGRTSNFEPITVSNAGGHAPLQISSVTLSNVVEFGLGTDNCSGTTVPVGASCTVEVAFTPQADGTQTGQLVVNDNTPAGKHTLSLSGTGSSSDPAVSPTANAPGNYPDWYQDANGVRLAPCTDGSDPNCLVLPDPGFDPSQPTVFPTNFPSEFFYGNADSDTLITPGCGGTTPGKAMVRVALEGSFANGVVNPGDQITFARLRIFVTSGLCPNVSYRFRTPYGDVPFQTDNNGALVRNQGTIDIGCNPVAPALCNFPEALTGPNPATGMNESYSFSFLRPDPVTGPTPPAGYLGDGKSLGKVTGGTYIAPGTSEPVNYAAIIDTADNTVLRTDRFLVSGKLAGSLSAGTPAVAFGQQLTGQPSAASTVTFTALKAGTTINALTVSGTNATAFAIDPAATTCTTGAAIAINQTCTVVLAFTPATAGPAVATLRVTTNNGPPVDIALSGSGYALASAVSPNKLDFGSVDSGTHQALPLTVQNKGTAAATVNASIPAGSDFTVDQSACAGQLAPNTNCVLSVVFAPSTTTTTAESDTLTITAAGETTTVPLTGTSNVGVGTPPPPTVAPTATAAPLAFGPVDLTNSRTLTATVSVGKGDTAEWQASAKPTITGAGPHDYTVVANSCTAAVEPGKSCTIGVKFAPSAVGTRSALLSIADNTKSGSTTVQLTGTGTGPVVTPPAPPVAPTATAHSLAFGAVGLTRTRTMTATVSVSKGDTANWRASAKPTITGAGGDYTIVANNCTVSVEPGKSCTIEVRFAPSTVGLRSALLSIADNTKSRSTTVQLTGTGVASKFSVSRKSIAFGSRGHGTTTVQTVTIRNTGTLAFRVATVRITGTNPRMFLAGTGCNARTLLPGRTCTFRVWFTPAAKRSYQADLVVSGDATTRPRTVTLRLAGTGR